MRLRDIITYVRLRVIIYSWLLYLVLALEIIKYLRQIILNFYVKLSTIFELFVDEIQDGFNKVQVRPKVKKDGSCVTARQYAVKLKITGRRTVKLKHQSRR